MEVRIPRIILYVLIVVPFLFALILVQRSFFLYPAKDYYHPPMILTSPAFDHKSSIPRKFTCDGGDMNPELLISNVPAETKSLALILDDPDAPSGTFTHWLVWNIDPQTTFIKEESKPPGSLEGETGFGRPGYGGPCPPSGSHRYFFRLFALDAMLDLPAGSSRAELEAEILKHKLAETELMGTYTRE